MAQRGATLALLGAILGPALGCAENSEDDATANAIAGGWSNEQEHRFLCIASDGRMWLGDSASEIGGTSRCTASDTDSTFHCRDPDDDDAFDGTIETSGNELTLEIGACTGDAADCRASYVRDPGVTCD